MQVAFNHLGHASNRQLLYSLKSFPVIKPILARCFASNTTSSQVKSTTEGDLVYQNPLKKYVVAAKIFSLSTSGIAICLQSTILAKLGDLGAVKFIVVGGFGVFVFLTPILLHMVTRSFVGQMYYNPSSDTYTAYTKGLFLNNRRHVFQPCDTDTNIASPFATVVAKSSKLFILPENFYDIEVYSHMMRYDKPLDLVGNRKK